MEHIIMVHVRQDEAASEDILKFQNSGLIKKIKPQCAKFNSVTTIYGFKLHQWDAHYSCSKWKV